MTPWTEALAAARHDVDQAQAALISTVQQARTSGATWDDIAAQFQVTRSAVIQRFGKYTTSNRAQGDPR